MEFRYLDFVNVMISIIGLNISILGILFSQKYKVDARILNIFGKKIMVKNTKVPLMIFLFNYIVILFYLAAELKYSAVEQYNSVMGQFIVIFAGVSFITVVFVFIAYMWIIQYNAYICDGRESVQKYTDFTSDVKTNSDILIVGGDLSFLGYLPEGNYAYCKTSCKQSLTEFNQNLKLPEETETDNKCPYFNKCMLHNVQLRQLVEKHKFNSIKIRILCNKPGNTIVDKKYRLMIAELYHLFNENIEIRFYNEDCANIPMRGRLKTANNGTREFLWQWKNDSDVFIFPDMWVDNTTIGKTIIQIYDTVIWNQSEVITDAKISVYENELRTYMRSKLR